MKSIAVNKCFVATTLLGVILTVGLMGCSSGNQMVTRSEGQQVAPAPRATQRPVAVNPDIERQNGSLWREDGLLSNLFNLPKARGIGDIVTIKVVESSSASNEANTSTERDSSLTAKIDAFLGLEKKYTDPAHPGYSAGRNFNPFGEINGGMTSAFEGSGATSRSGDLTAFITARVTDITPTGNLRIEGSREVEVNNEKQFITISGFVRPRDIASDNVVISTFISDARIAYTGDGVIDDRQRPGWMSNFVNTIWPF